MIRNRHELAEERSLAFHEEVLRRLGEDPGALDEARARVEEWIRTRSVHAEYALSWRQILSRPLAEIGALLRERSERASALRQVTPFAGLVPPRTRWRIWREVEERLARSP